MPRVRLLPTGGEPGVG